MNRILVASLFLFSLCAFAEEPAYEIVLNRPVKVADRYRVVTTTHETGSYRASAGKKLLEEKSEDITVDLTALVSVVDIDAKGRPTKLTFAVEKSNLKDGPRNVPVVTAGTIVQVVRENGEQVFNVAGRRLGGEQAKALAMVISLPESEETDDDIFGTKEEKRVGDVWPVNSAVAARSFATTGLTVGEKDVTGEVTLKGVTRSGYDTFLDLGAWMELNNIGMPLPEGFKTTTSRARMVFGSRLPVGRGRKGVKESAKISMELIASGRANANSPVATIEVRNERTSSTTYSER